MQLYFKIALASNYLKALTLYINNLIPYYPAKPGIGMTSFLPRKLQV
jgi:hypothetical protein